MTKKKKVINTNLKAVFLLSQAAGRHMVPLHRGRIINFASLLTFQGGLTVPAYAASKGGLAQLTKSLSNEWSSSGVCVNAIAPGYVETEMNARLMADEVRFRQISERIPAGRWGTVEDFMGVVVFLASRASQYVCGEVIVVDGVSWVFFLSFPGVDPSSPPHSSYLPEIPVHVGASYRCFKKPRSLKKSSFPPLRITWRMGLLIALDGDQFFIDSLMDLDGAWLGWVGIVCLMNWYWIL